MNDMYDDAGHRAGRQLVICVATTSLTRRGGRLVRGSKGCVMFLTRRQAAYVMGINARVGVNVGWRIGVMGASLNAWTLN